MGRATAAVAAAGVGVGGCEGCGCDCDGLDDRPAALFVSSGGGGGSDDIPCCGGSGGGGLLLSSLGGRFFFLSCLSCFSCCGGTACCRVAWGLLEAGELQECISSIEGGLLPSSTEGEPHARTVEGEPHARTVEGELRCEAEALLLGRESALWSSAVPPGEVRPAIISPGGDADPGGDCDPDLGGDLATISAAMLEIAKAHEAGTRLLPRPPPPPPPPPLDCAEALRGRLPPSSSS